MPAPRGPRLALEQMLEATLDIERFTAGQTFDDYVADRRNRRAVERVPSHPEPADHSSYPDERARE